MPEKNYKQLIGISGSIKLSDLKKQLDDFIKEHGEESCCGSYFDSGMPCLALYVNIKEQWPEYYK